MLFWKTFSTREGSNYNPFETWHLQKWQWGFLYLIIDGRCLLANLKSKTVLHRCNFKKPVFDLKFSPCGRWVLGLQRELMGCMFDRILFCNTNYVLYFALVGFLLCLKTGQNPPTLRNRQVVSKGIRNSAFTGLLDHHVCSQLKSFM